MKLEVVVTETVDAEPAAVWEAFTDERILPHWFRPGESSEVLSAETDPRPGGRYRIRLTGTEGEFSVAGVYLELERNRRLRFSWHWESGPFVDEPPSAVSVELIPRGPKTEILVTHTALAANEIAESHRVGWLGALAHLEFWLREKSS
jgi:uncharacterized protein YndB with AHSA1/START domain